MRITLQALITSTAQATEQQHKAPSHRPTPEYAAASVQPVSTMPAHKRREATTLATSADTPRAPVQPQQAAVTPPPPGLRSSIEPGRSAETTAAQGSEQQRNNLMLILRQALDEQFRYPPLARKHGWQGKVLLAFTLDTRGTIIDARIAQSSGYGTLDNAAIASLTRVATIEAGPSQALSFELPVIYRLNGG
jgi:protein TonB